MFLSRKLSILISLLIFIFVGLLWYTRTTFDFMETFPVSSFYEATEVTKRPQKIPFLLCTTLPSTQRVSKEVNDVIEQNRNQNPEYSFHCYDDLQCHQFIQTHFPYRVCMAFDTLVPGAFKADLFRYCFLYMYGGVYIDANKRLAKPLHRIIEPSTELILVMDRKQNRVGGQVHPDFTIQPIYQAFLAVVPRHPFIKQCIDQCVHHVENKYYGNTALDITGPVMMGKVFRDCYHQWLHETLRSETLLVFKHGKDGKNVFDPYQTKDNTIIHTNMPSKKKNQTRFWKQKHYATHWNNRSVFKKNK